MIIDITSEVRSLKIDRSTLRNFAFLWCGVFGFLSVLLFRQSQNSYYYFALLSVCSLFAAYLFPLSLRRIYQAWMLLSFVLGWFMSRVILAGVYFLLISPIGIVLRLFGKDLLNTRIDPDATTYWKKYTPPSDSVRYEKQY